MPITFYSMGARCGYCVKAQKLLEKEISDGHIVVKSAGEAPKSLGFTGFPAFEYNGRKSTGLPSSFKALCLKLGYSVEKYTTSAIGSGYIGVF